MLMQIMATNAWKSESHIAKHGEQLQLVEWDDSSYWLFKIAMESMAHLYPWL